MDGIGLSEIANPFPQTSLSPRGARVKARSASSKSEGGSPASNLEHGSVANLQDGVASGLSEMPE